MANDAQRGGGVAARAAGETERFRGVRRTTLALREPLSAEDCCVQSMPDASPAKWHLAHTSWFFETFALEPSLPGYTPFHPAYRVIFNSYYNSVGEQHPRPRRGMLSRPPLDEVLRYREVVDRSVVRLLDDRDELEERLLDVIELGCHHEQQHQELLLTDAKHMLAQSPLLPAYRPDLPDPDDAEVKPLTWHGYGGGLHEIGHGGAGFHFDNEGPRHRVHLEPFEIASRPVTNGEYLAFMADGGYRRPELWLSDGWAAAQAEGWRAPLYWVAEGEGDPDAWHVFTLGGLRRLRRCEPVCHLSYYEADAFATWAAARLPSEAEWEVAASQAAVQGNLLEEGRLHPVASPDGGERPAALYGDVWEWTRSAYSPYPGYRPPEGALGEYNGKFMCNQLVLRGGSCATPRSHLRATYRNFFPAGARWQFSGLRLARDGG